MNEPIETGINPENDRPLTQQNRQDRKVVVSVVLGVVLILAILFVSLYFLLRPATSAEYVARIRDVFIIVMALESLLIGAVLVILIIQIARLTNLLQNEIKPILDSTNETVSTLRGTSEFLSDKLVEPVMKLNEYGAGLQRLLEVLGMIRKKK